MLKQRQQACHGPRKRSKYSSLNDKNLKKNKQILEAYVMSTPKSRSGSVFQLIEQRPSQSSKKKSFSRYYLINPKAKLHRNAQTQLSDQEDDNRDELKNLKSQIKQLQRQFEEKRMQQYEDEYLSQIKSIKSEILQLKNLQKGNSDKKTEEQDFYNDIYGIKSQIRQIKKQLKQKKSNSFLPPISNNSSLNINPQNISLPVKRNALKKSSQSRRIGSGNPYHQDQLQDLRQQVDDLKREIYLNRDLKNKNSNHFQSHNRQNQNRIQSPNGKKFQGKNQQIQRLRNIYSRNSHDQSAEEQKQNKNRRRKTLQKIKKAVNAVLFVNRLQKISQKIRLKRQNFFKQSFKDGLLTQVKTIRDTYVKATLQFTNSLPINDPLSSVVIVSTDNQSQRITKAGLARKCINKFLDAIKETQFLPNIMQSLTESCYFVCRHGSAGVLSNFFTSEELDIMCISKDSLKVMAEKNLQKSQVISFVWVKLIIFNILLRTETIPELKLQKNTIWNANFCLFGSIIYELCRKIQAEMIERAPINYVIGNWKHINFLNSKHGSNFKKINPSKSMTISLKQHESTLKTEDIQDQLLRGTVSRKYLADAYQYNDWETQIRRISNYVQLIHRRMCKYHAKLKNQLL